MAARSTPRGRGMSGVDCQDIETGLRIVDEPYPNGIRARAVYRGDACIYHGAAAGVRHFVAGYAMAKAAPIEDLMCDPRISDKHLLEAAEALPIEAREILS